jgi:hypothetical protein
MVLAVEGTCSGDHHQQLGAEREGNFRGVVPGAQAAKPSSKAPGLVVGYNGG